LTRVIVDPTSDVLVRRSGRSKIRLNEHIVVLKRYRRINESSAASDGQRKSVRDHRVDQRHGDVFKSPREHLFNFVDADHWANRRILNMVIQN
jgi:hypothetical protein